MRPRFQMRLLYINSTYSRAELESNLDEIHAAGVLHRDLRSWNLLVNLQGSISIIDFDRATLSAHPNEYAAEKHRMQRFLKGERIDFDRAIGRDGIAENIFELIMDNN